MKLIFWLIVGYLGYKFWWQPKMLQGGKSEKNDFTREENKNQSNYDDDYIDYEEIKD
ncbi:MAG: hypothetical protein ACPGXZ_03325 [Saprospiraceae bacterium]